MMSLRTWRTICAASLVACGAAASHATEILVPAYFYPSSNPAQSLWPAMTAALAQGAHVTAIMNPGNGPGPAANSDYSAAVDAFRAAGGRVLGYVYTCYGGTQCAASQPATRTTADVLADVQHYADWYHVDGVFLDEMSNRNADLPFYATISTSLRAAHAGWQIVGNPGTATPAEYLAVADTLVTFEGAGDSYAASAPLPWMGSADPARHAHLFYNASGTASMQSLLAQAVARHAGYGYITDDRYTPNNPAEPNPWDQLPTYFTAEAAAVAAVPEVPAVWLSLAGLAALGLRIRSTSKR